MARDPVEDLQRVAFLMERRLDPTAKVRAFRNAAATLLQLPRAEYERHAAEGSWTELPGIGASTAAVITQSLDDALPERLRDLEAQPVEQGSAAAQELRARLRGDCHTHSDWSDGGSPILEMATTARALGHEYMVLTDHSPRLRVANGLSTERLLQQLDVVAELNEQLAPFRILTGIEVDILDDGALDQSDEMLDRLDLVVGSVHSKLRMPAEQMTPRMVAAVANPRLDVLGHCTGRMIMGPRERPQSEFDAELVFAACAQFGVAVEINSRPERQDPPAPLLTLALEAGCLTSIDTDAHAPGQLDWQWRGCEKAVECSVPVESIVDTWSADQLIGWANDHAVRP